MRFVQIISEGKFTLISIFLFLYVILNLIDGERGLISYYEKKEVINQLSHQEKTLTLRLALIERKNQLLTNTIDTDYLEILYRKKFMVGNEYEKIYIE